MVAPHFNQSLLPFVQQLEAQADMHGAIEDQMELCFAALRLIACAASVVPGKEARRARRASRDQLIDVARKTCVALDLTFDLASVNRDIVSPPAAQAPRSTAGDVRPAVSP
jgi:hypothetical protein